jgi:hypothetical protein
VREEFENKQGQWTSPEEDPGSVAGKKANRTRRVAACGAFIVDNNYRRVLIDVKPLIPCLQCKVNLFAIVPCSNLCAALMSVRARQIRTPIGIRIFRRQGCRELWQVQAAGLRNRVSERRNESHSQRVSVSSSVNMPAICQGLRLQMARNP